MGEQAMHIGDKEEIRMERGGGKKEGGGGGGGGKWHGERS